MDEARRKILSSILDIVLETPLENQASVIEELCKGDSTALEFVRRMLEMESRADASSFLKSPLMEPNRQLWPDAAAGSPGAVFGSYVLMRRIGQGGMGEVYLAERRDGAFEQRVALKLLPFPTPNLMQRFRRERQILASLEHPNIARLLDGGIGAESVPYFAMEYVEGVAITQHCREQLLDVRQTLVLFELICAAVQYAHRNLVVHRDLKPSNILVTKEGVPKLLDFGIAKILESSDVGHVTQTAARVFTPDYAAPEQIRGDAVTTSTDVYSLGIVLYELLVGAKPFDSSTYASFQAGICDFEARLPSAALGGKSRAKRNELRGDIDRIVLTAIAQEPARRYGSVEAFSNDIRRHLDGQPISIRTDARFYRLQKFVNRNRPLVAVATLLVVTLMAAGTGILWQARRVSQEAAKTTAVNGFLRSVFSVTDPDVNKGESISATDMLDRSAARLESEFVDERELKVDLQNTLGGLYLTLGEYERAKDLFEKSLTLQAIYPEQNTSTFANSLLNLASANIALDHYRTAEPELRQAIVLFKKSHEENAPNSSKAMRLLGTIYTALGRSKDAEPLLTQALAIDRKIGADVEASDDLVALAAFDFRIHRYKESVGLYRRALETYREKLGAANSKTVLTQSELADATFFAGDIGLAINMSRESAESSKKLFGQNHPLSLRAQRKLALLLAENNFYDEAEPLLSDLLVRTRATLGPRHSDVAEVLLAFVEYDFGRGRYDDALAAAREANGIWRDALGEKNERLEEGLKDVAACEQALGQFDNAVRDLNAALELSRTLAGDKTITYADLEQTLGKVYIQMGDASSAEPYCSDAEKIASEVSGPEDPLMAEAQFCIAALTSRRGDRATAVELWNKALATAKHAYADAPLQQERFTYPLAKALTIADRQDAALITVDDDMRMRKSQFGEGSVSVANVQALRATILSRLERKVEATRELKQAIATCRMHPGITQIDCLPKLPGFDEECQRLVGTVMCASR